MLTRSLCSEQNAPWWLAAILLLTVLLYYPVLGYDFLRQLDDSTYVVNNYFLAWSWPNLRALFSRTFVDLYTPLPVATCMLDYALGGLDPRCYHLQNLVWHLLGTVLVYSVLRRLRLRPGWALFFTLCYAVHPQRIESVAWISERKDVLLAVCFWGSVRAYLSDRKWGRVAAWLLMGCAMLCKPLGIFLPAVFYLLDTVRFRRWRRTPRELGALIPYGVLTLAYLGGYSSLFFNTAQKVFEDAPSRWLPFYNLLRYPAKMLLPVELTPFYPETVFGPGLRTLVVLALALIALGGWWLYRRWPRRTRTGLLPLALLFGLLLFPVLGWSHFSNAQFADRYSLLPTVVLYLALGLLLPGCRSVQKRGWRLAAALYVGMLLLLSFWYLPVWRDDRCLLEYACDTPSPNYRALIAYADYCHRLGEFELGAAVLQHPVAQGRLMSRFQGQFLSALARAVKGDVEPLRFYDTPEQRERLLLLNRKYPADVSGQLANAALRRGDREAAIGHFRDILDFYPDDRFLGAFYRGMIAFLRDDRVTAEREWREALSYAPDDAATRSNLERVAP